MTAVMIGIDPHKASHTAVVISAAEEMLGEVRVRACASQAEQLLAWAAAWPERTWAVEGAAGMGHLLAQELLSAGDLAYQNGLSVRSVVRSRAQPRSGLIESDYPKIGNGGDGCHGRARRQA
jgi:hypothetical protein